MRRAGAACSNLFSVFNTDPFRFGNRDGIDAKPAPFATPWLQWSARRAGRGHDSPANSAATPVRGALRGTQTSVFSVACRTGPKVAPDFGNIVRSRRALT